jgi:outer membrane biosynthesis protein TonB
MATKKSKTKKKKPATKRAVVKSKATAAKSPKKSKVVKKKPAPKKKPASKAKAKATAQKQRFRTKQQLTETVVAPTRRGLGSNSGGQSGDTQGLSTRPQGDSESVTELEEEGQYFEAEAVRGVENADDPDVSEVHTHEVPEDDVPGEYDEKETDTD